MCECVNARNCVFECSFESDWEHTKLPVYIYILPLSTQDFTLANPSEWPVHFQIILPSIILEFVSIRARNRPHVSSSYRGVVAAREITITGISQRWPHNRPLPLSRWPLNYRPRWFTWNSEPASSTAQARRGRGDLAGAEVEAQREERRDLGTSGGGSAADGSASLWTVRHLNRHINKLNSAVVHTCVAII